MPEKKKSFLDKFDKKLEDKAKKKKCACCK